MHLTLHLTDRCNLRCRYCYAAPGEADMSFETARAAIERLAVGENCGIIFFGGEPLLKRALIAEILEWCERERPRRFHYKVTTNGTLLDEEFLDLSERFGLQIALSHDGAAAAHDALRVRPDGSGTFAELEPKLALLLARRPYAPVMMVVDPATVGHFAAGVKHLWGRSARYLICSLNHAGAWDDHVLGALRRQYQELADWYLERFAREEKVTSRPSTSASPRGSPGGTPAHASWAGGRSRWPLTEPPIPAYSSLAAASTPSARPSAASTSAGATRSTPSTRARTPNAAAARCSAAATTSADA